MVTWFSQRGNSDVPVDGYMISQRGYSDGACWWLHDLVNVVTVRKPVDGYMIESTWLQWCTCWWLHDLVNVVTMMYLLAVTWFSQRGYSDIPVFGYMI